MVTGFFTGDTVQLGNGLLLQLECCFSFLFCPVVPVFAIPIADIEQLACGSAIFRASFITAGVEAAFQIFGKIIQLGQIDVCQNRAHA